MNNVDLAYLPDNWVVVKVSKGYKVLAGWSSSYLEGSSWRMNSGITEVHEDQDHFLFHGFSGSVYACHKDRYGMNMSSAGIFKQMKDAYPQVELMPEDTDWMKVDWEWKT
jgi:hypothetical protein